MFVGVLERLHQAQCFVHRPPDGQIVHGDLSQNASGVDDKQTTQGVTNLLKVNTVVLRDLVRLIGQQWNVELAEATLLARCLQPGQVRVGRVHRACHHLGVDGAKFLHTIAERNNLRGADKGAKWQRTIRTTTTTTEHNSQIQGIEEKDQIFAAKLRQIHFLHFVVEDGGGLPLGSRFHD